MKKLLITLILGIFLFSLVSASDLGTFKQGECVELYQFCDDCTYVNLTTIKYPNGDINLTLNEEMTKTNQNFNYEFCGANSTGDYSYVVCGDKRDIFQCEEIDFKVTPSGKSGTDNLLFFMVILALLYTLTLILFFSRSIELAPFVALCGMTLGTFGVYIISNGVFIYRDWITNSVAYLTIGLGFGLGLISLIEWIQDVM